MKKLSFIVGLLLLSTAAFAEEATGGMSSQSWKYLAYFFGMSIAVFGGTRAQSLAAAKALDGIARNPSAADKIQTPMILGLALMESLVIFMFASVFVA